MFELLTYIITIVMIRSVSRFEYLVTTLRDRLVSKYPTHTVVNTLNEREIAYAVTIILLLIPILNIFIAYKFTK